MDVRAWRFEARKATDGIAWEVWDVTDADHTPVAVFDSKGSADDFHEENAKITAGALNARRFGITRPTADLGEDGELVERLRELASFNREHFPRTAEDGFYALADEAADRLILYREALDRAVIRLIEQHDEPWPGGTDADRLHYWRDKAIEVAGDLRAVLSRSGG